MSKCPHCNPDTQQGESDSIPASATLGVAARPNGLIRRASKSMQWLFPTALLILMPKCPFCVAAYVALFTGIGITVSAARWIQVFMLMVCLSSLAYLVVRYVRRRHRADGIAAAS